MYKTTITYRTKENEKPIVWDTYSEKMVTRFRLLAERKGYEILDWKTEKAN